MTEPPIKRNHHHVPVFHLKQWHGDDGKFFVYWKYGNGSVNCEKKPAKARFFERDLYLLKDDVSPLGNNATRPDAIEDGLAKQIDDPAAPVLKKMIGGSGPDFTLKDEEKEVWARYVYSLIHRTPEKIKELGVLGQRAFNELTEEMRSGATCQDSRESIEKVIELSRLSNDHINYPLATLLDGRLMDPFVTGLVQFRWGCWDLEGHEFIMAPDPVMKWENNDGIVMLALPLSPHKIWIAYPKRWEEEDMATLASVQKNAIVLYNTNIAMRPQKYFISHTEIENHPPYNWYELMEQGLLPFERPKSE